VAEVDKPRRVAILGGGMAGLAAAWRLTRPDGPRPAVTLYQRGWRLGGKGASSRGRNGRIEEHGLHVWPGYYDNAFSLIRSCYDELDRTRLDASCPIPGWRDAFLPASVIGLGDEGPQGWLPWVGAFPENTLVPGERDRRGDPGQGVELVEFMQRAMGLLSSFGESLGPGSPPTRAVLSSGPTPPRRVRPQPAASAAAMLRLASDPASVARTAHLAELLAAMARGVAADRLVARGYSAIDHLDFREWLARHGPSTAALDGPLVGGMYDLVFGYERGDHGRPRFAAGLGLHLAARLFFTYRGAIFWKMRAGMGDVVFAPLYQALVRRGVRFRFFHRLDQLQLAEDGQTVATVRLGRQVALGPGRVDYDPLVRVGGLPVFPAGPDLAQLRAGPELIGHDLESHWCEWPDASAVRLESGRDFDRIVLAVSLGMVPLVAGQLIDHDPRWRAMTEQVKTVATQACQLWLNEDERWLGWAERAAVVTGCGEPFDTFASMSHTLPFEAWPDGRRPTTAASFCAVLPEPSTPVGSGPLRGSEQSGAPRQAVRANVARFLTSRICRLWPASIGPDGFNWDLLAGGGPVTGPDRLDSQYWRANVDPSDRYVQSLPGTGQYRLRVDGSGLENLVLAGDWVDSGLNAGCIEAAVLSGIQAANAIEGRALDEGTVGFRPRSGSDR
jgi:uncharacterized protein with NAD-binding domain and iron-sulfur cluster